MFTPSFRRATPSRLAARTGPLLVRLTSWLMILMMAVSSSLYSGPDTDGSGNPITRILWLLFLAIGLGYVASNMAQVRRVWRHLNLCFILFVALAALSTFWSIDPAQTIRNMVRMVTMCAAALAVAVAGWTPRSYQQIIRPVLTLTMVASIILGIAAPQLAIHQEQQAELLNAWRGVYATKNALGAVASFTFILWAHAWIAREAPRSHAVFGALVSGACLVLCRSSTSMITTILAIFALLLLLRPPMSMRRSIPYLTSGLVVIILLYSLAMLKVVPGLEILTAPIPYITGKDLTFSNRADIWAAVVEHVKYRPILGSGYSAYWSMGTPTPDMESYFIKSRLDGFYPGSSHNGYLQVLNDLGAVGLCVLLGFLYLFVRDSIRLYRFDRTQGALLIVLFLQQTTVNLTEPLWLNVLLVEFVLVAMATTTLARGLAEVRQPARSARPMAAEPAPPAPPARAVRRRSPRFGPRDVRARE